METKRIKIIDFGLARKLNPNEVIQDMAGTPEFCGKFLNISLLQKNISQYQLELICARWCGNTVEDVHVHAYKHTSLQYLLTARVNLSTNCAQRSELAGFCTLGS